MYYLCRIYATCKFVVQYILGIFYLFNFNLFDKDNLSGKQRRIWANAEQTGLVKIYC